MEPRVLSVTELPDMHYGPDLEREFERRWVELMTPDLTGLEWAARVSIAWERADAAQSFEPRGAR